MSPRREFSAAVRRAAWERCNGQCEGFVQITEEDLSQLIPYNAPLGSLRRCNAPLYLSGASFHYDHIDPDFFGSNNRAELSNCQVLCRECHKTKTAKDKRDIAKTKRIIDKRMKARKPRGRAMPGTKRSGIRKRMSGRVERW